MRRAQHEMLALVHEGRLLLGIGTPEQKDDRVAFIVDGADDGVGEFFPALPLMRGGAGLFHRQHAVEQKHTLFRPAFQKTVTDRANAEIALQLLVDIDERGGMRTPG